MRYEWLNLQLLAIRFGLFTLLFWVSVLSLLYPIVIKTLFETNLNAEVNSLLPLIEQGQSGWSNGSDITAQQQARMDHWYDAQYPMTFGYRSESGATIWRFGKAPENYVISHQHVFGFSSPSSVAEFYYRFLTAPDNQYMIVTPRDSATTQNSGFLVSASRMRKLFWEQSTQLAAFSAVAVPIMAILSGLFLSRAVYQTVYNYDKTRLNLDAMSRQDRGLVYKPSLKNLIKKVAAHDQEEARLARLGNDTGQGAHDMRNILSSLRLNAELMQNSEDDHQKKLGHNIDRIVAQCLSLMEWAAQVASKKRKTLITEPHLLRSILEEAYEFTEMNKNASEVELIVDCPTSLWVMADRTKLFRVFYNLMFNSVEAMARTPLPHQISVSVRAENDTCLVYVVDTGSGYQAPQASNRLDGPRPTSSDDQAPQQSGKSTGLGLRIAHDILEWMGGSLHVLSPKAGGACFLVSFPFGMANKPEVINSLAGNKRMWDSDEWTEIF